jgi:hypothetical protein
MFPIPFSPCCSLSLSHYSIILPRPVYSSSYPLLSSPCLAITYSIRTESVLLSCPDYVEAVLQQLSSMQLSSPCPYATYSIWTCSVLQSLADVETILQQLTSSYPVHAHVEAVLQQQSLHYPAHVPLSPIPLGQEVFSCPVLM